MKNSSEFDPSQSYISMLSERNKNQEYSNMDLGKIESAKEKQNTHGNSTYDYKNDLSEINFPNGINSFHGKIRDDENMLQNSTNETSKESVKIISNIDLIFGGIDKDSENDNFSLKDKNNKNMFENTNEIIFSMQNNESFTENLIDNDKASQNSDKKSIPKNSDSLSAVKKDDNFINDNFLNFFIPGENTNEKDEKIVQSLPNDNVLMSENPAKSSANGNDLEIFGNILLSSNNQIMENPFEGDSRNIFTDQLQSHNAPVLNNFNDEIEYESSRNRSTLINDVNENGKGDTNEALNDTASTHLSENSNMESLADLFDGEELPQRPPEALTSSRMSPCCKYASKVLGIFNSKKNKSFSDNTKRCFCAHCPRYFNLLSKNHASTINKEGKKSERLSPSTYWTRALWLTLQCMKF
ncbi:uncharacterized protein CDAR_554991 [Caerostris darwini]|uniref:Uncharacterized protein n=1 Tax=Caerostris darwini TaxID=1538125 RepID=A0AAV4RI53_9ARAC|nr:uncharacterized protein CDAR_554991 [Caerostris darwini]